MNYIIDGPVGLDKEVQKTQVIIFDNLKTKWKTEGVDVNKTLDVFGRVRKNPINQSGFFPEAYIGNGEYRDLYLNDGVNATVCFIEEDNKDHSTDDFGEFYFADGKFVFMVNLKKCYPTINHRADSEAQLEAISQLKKNKMFTIDGIQKGLPNIFKGFEISKITTDDMHPFHIFAITGTMKYKIKINC